MTTSLKQQSFSKYNIQQTNYLLQLPKDTINIINSYLFYDKISGETRIKMRNIIETFKNACQTRANPRLTNNEELCEHWSIWMADIRDLYVSNEVQFQAYSCKMCGGYNSISGYYEIPIRARCNC